MSEEPRVAVSGSVVPLRPEGMSTGRKFKYDKGDWIAVRDHHGQWVLGGKIVDANSESVCVDRRGIRTVVSPRRGSYRSYSLDREWKVGAPVTSDEIVREITRAPKAQLVQRLELWAQEHNRRWIVGGPRQWSKDELVSACVRIAEGQEP